MTVLQADLQLAGLIYFGVIIYIAALIVFWRLISGGKG